MRDPESEPCRAGFFDDEPEFPLHSHLRGDGYVVR